MIDPAVLLTPVLLLAVLLLVGYAGCLEPPPPPRGLFIRVRVPTSLTVTEITFRTVNPAGQMDQAVEVDPAPGGTDGGDNLFSYKAGEALEGAWTVGARVTVGENGATAQDGAQASAILDGTNEYARADFRALGSPSGGDFAVVFVGVTEG